MGCPFEVEGDGSDISFFFENGRSSRYGYHSDPSSDLDSKLKEQMRYQRLALKRKEAEFEGLKALAVENLSWVRRSPNSVPPLDYEGVVLPSLQKLRNEILLHRKRIEEISEQYKTETEDGRRLAVVEKMKRDEQRNRDEILAATQRKVDAINALKI
jgi:hypothetical protein